MPRKRHVSYPGRAAVSTPERILLIDMSTILYALTAADRRDRIRAITCKRLRGLERRDELEDLGAFHHDDHCWLRVYGTKDGRGRIVQRSLEFTASNFDPSAYEDPDGYGIDLEPDLPSGKDDFDDESSVWDNYYGWYDVECEFHLATDCPITKLADQLRRKRARLGSRFPAHARALMAIRQLADVSA